jgi:hypothetical protein
MFLDESGNHGLIKVDPLYPLFVLGGIICDQVYAETEIEARVRSLKRDLFGDESLILHTADMMRNRAGFERMHVPSFRKAVIEAINQLMQDLEYQVVACVIQKDAHLARYGIAALDPYLLSLDVLVERFCFELQDEMTQGFIVAEKRSPVLDRELDLAWLNLKVHGTRYLQAKTINERVSHLITRDKRENIAGLQLADLVVSPIGRFVLGKRPQNDWRIVESKLRRRVGSYDGPGLVILPKE